MFVSHLFTVPALMLVGGIMLVIPGLLYMMDILSIETVITVLHENSDDPKIGAQFFLCVFVGIGVLSIVAGIWYLRMAVQAYRTRAQLERRHGG